MRLHACPPLSAFITVRQCASNAKLGRAAARAKPLDPKRLAGFRYDVCAACPGVLALDAGTREVPERVRVAAGGRRRKKTMRLVPAFLRQGVGAPGYDGMER